MKLVRALLGLIFYSLIGMFIFMLMGFPWWLMGLPWWLFAALGVMFVGACVKEVKEAVQTKRRHVRSDVEQRLVELQYEYIPGYQHRGWEAEIVDLDKP